ncbi:MAG TPA: hypothetical protein VMT62_02340 [Syntrophorhabdaceae bacterium]|nr:hypothetical protein [Syntrophorhabdaceae bacterium]
METSYFIHDELPDKRRLSERLRQEDGAMESHEILKAEPLPDAAEPFLRRGPREHLKEAKKALADGYRPNRDPMKAAWGRVAQAERHLRAIDSRSKAYGEARSLMKVVATRKKAIEKVSAALAKRLMIRQREMLTDEFEFFYLSRGMDARIVLTGPEKAHLRMECPHLSEAFVHRMVNDTDFLVYLGRAGFVRVTLGDGEGFVWTYQFSSEEV